MSDPNTIPNQWLEERARDLYADDDLEIDYGLNSEDFSHAEGGAWVKAWVWVPYPEVIG